MQVARAERGVPEDMSGVVVRGHGDAGTTVSARDGDARTTKAALSGDGAAGRSLSSRTGQFGSGLTVSGPLVGSSGSLM